MAYNSYFPAGYMPLYNAQIQPQDAYNPQQQMNPQAMQNRMQNGFVRVQSEEQARQYPVSQGTSVIFIDENAPYCYTKTMDMSQLDKPRFEKYRLVKESPSDPHRENDEESKKLSSRLSNVENELEALKAKIKQISDSVCESVQSEHVQQSIHEL